MTLMMQERWLLLLTRFASHPFWNTLVSSVHIASQHLRLVPSHMSPCWIVSSPAFFTSVWCFLSCGMVVRSCDAYVNICHVDMASPWSGWCASTLCTGTGLSGAFGFLLEWGGAGQSADKGRASRFEVDSGTQPVGKSGASEWLNVQWMSKIIFLQFIIVLL